MTVPMATNSSNAMTGEFHERNGAFAWMWIAFVDEQNWPALRSLFHSSWLRLSRQPVTTTANGFDDGVVADRFQCRP